MVGPLLASSTERSQRTESDAMLKFWKKNVLVKLWRIFTCYVISRILTGIFFHEIDLRAIGHRKYVCTGILEYLKNQVENHSKIDNYVNNQESVAFSAWLTFN